jgi:excinuclease ABC subunit C
MTKEEFAIIAKGLPHLPGIYQYYGEENKLLYVGKAKDLRKRIASYFTQERTTYKTHELVKRIRKIEYTVVDTEQDAFLLENALIKEYHPRYNIMLKDDKTYPYIIIKKEPFPRVFLTRKKYPDGSEYLGPFTSVGKVRELMELVRQMIPLRTCKLPLSKKNIAKGNFKVCLEFHLGNCKGPCEDRQTEEDYNESLQQVRDILKGNLQPVTSLLKKNLKEAIQKLMFEEAAVIQKKLSYLEAYQARSVVVGKLQGYLDVFTLSREGATAFVNYLMVQNGTIIQTHPVQLETSLGESDEEVLIFAISNIRSQFNSMANEIVVPFALSYPEIGITITVPKGGDKKKLLDLSLKNVAYYQKDLQHKKLLHTSNDSNESRTNTLASLQELLHLPAIPKHIECFDNSHFQGGFPVSAMVCFKNGSPAKDHYRRFNVKTVTGIDDFATMKEVVSRRYKRLYESGESLPDLIVIDGGKGQLNAALESLEELGLTGKMTVIGLAKNKEEIFFPGDRNSIQLPWNSDALRLIRQIRDEVHRFGIQFHRNQRSKGTFKNELEEIPGIGKKTAELLLSTFSSVKKIRELPKEKLENLLGRSKAEIVWNYFNKG